MAALLLMSGLAQAAADNGLVSEKSHYGIQETLDRLEGVLRKKGFHHRPAFAA